MSYPACHVSNSARNSDIYFRLRRNKQNYFKKDDFKKSKLSTSQTEDEQRRHFADVLGSRRSVGRVNLRLVKKRLMNSRISVTRSAEFINGVEVKRREPSIGNDVIEYTYEKRI